MKIVVLDGYTLNPGDNPWHGLDEFGDVELFDRTSADQVIERSVEADVLIVNKVRLTDDTLAKLPLLKFISVTATGFDCVDVAAARDRGIAVSNVPVYGTDSVAQYVFAMLLHILLRIDVHDEAVKQDQWRASGEFSFWKKPLVELAGLQMGIVGFGRIGQRVGQLANAFGMAVVANTQPPRVQPNYEPFRWADFDQLLSTSDVISLNCPLTEETKGMIDHQRLASLKESAILINASRGPLIVEQHLADALNQGKLAAAGVDVVSAEPIQPDNPLLAAKNCFITPHLAWATLAARQRLMRTTIQNVQRFAAGDPVNVVN